MAHTKNDTHAIATDEQVKRGFAAENARNELSDEELSMVSGGCRKAGGGEVEGALYGTKSIIAI